jgi:hypothetical protein
VGGRSNTWSVKANIPRGPVSTAVTGAEREAWCAWDDAICRERRKWGLGVEGRGGFPGGGGCKAVLILIVEDWV